MIGCDAIHPSDFVYDVPPHHGYYLLILTRTPAVFRIGEEEKEYPAHHAALFTPECRIHYRASGELYRNDWMIFWSDEPYVTQFPRTGEPFAVTDPEYDHTLFQLLTWEHNQNNYEMVISQLMSVLFQKLSADLKTPAMDEYSLLLQSVHRAVMSNPEKDWTVSGIAEQLHISPGYLQLLYKQQFGISCMEDVIRCRIRLARDYLTHTHIGISEIAALCGYHSAEHFSRQFHKACGVSPGQFRKQPLDVPEQ